MSDRRQTVRKSMLQALAVLDPSEEACVYLKDALDLLEQSESIFRPVRQGWGYRPESGTLPGPAPLHKYILVWDGPKDA